MAEARKMMTAIHWEVLKEIYRRAEGKPGRMVFNIDKVAKDINIDFDKFFTALKEMTDFDSPRPGYFTREFMNGVLETSLTKLGVSKWDNKRDEQRIKRKAKESSEKDAPKKEVVAPKEEKKLPAKKKAPKKAVKPKK